MISAKFVADFTDFQTKVKQADVSLNAFEQSTAKVGTALNRLTTSFSGTKIMQEAALTEEAVLRIGGASKLTEAEQAKVNKTITEALAKYKALGIEAPQSLVMMADETRKLEAVTRPASASMQMFGDHFRGVLAGMLSAEAIIGGVKAAFSALSAFVSSSIKSYADAEAAQKKLTTALQAAGQASPMVVGQFNALAKQFQQTTVYSDDLVTEMQALLVQVGSVMPHQMEGALQAATNLASGLGIDLRQATMLVGKAFEGETGTLKRYGIVIDEAKLKAEGMPAVLDAIQQRFGGQAASEAETYAGKIKQLANEWDNFKESVGEAIVDDPLVSAFLKNLADRAKAAGDSAEGAGLHFSAFAVELVSGSQALADYVEILGGLERLLNNTAVSAQKLAKAIPAPRGLTGGSRPLQFGQSPADPGEIRALWDAQIKAEAAAKKHAETIRTLSHELSDAKLAGEVKKLSSALAGLKTQGAPSAAELDRLGKAAKKLFDEGATLTPELSKIMVTTQHMIPDVKALGSEIFNVGKAFSEWYAVSIPMMPVTNGLTQAVWNMGHTFAIELTPEMKEANENSKALKSSLSDVSAALSDLEQVSGGAFKGVVSGLATMVSAANTANESLKALKAGLKAKESFEGLLSMTTGVLGLVSAAVTAGKVLANLFDRNKGRDLVEDFAASMGGFDALHEQLLTLGEAGELLWIKLTQGVGRNNPAQAQAAIDEVAAALEKQRRLQDAATVSTEAGAQATIETATQATLALDELSGRLLKNADEWGAWSADVTGYLQKLADDIRAMPLPTPGGSSTVPGDMRVRGPARPPIVIDNRIELDGEVVARNQMRHLPDVVHTAV